MITPLGQRQILTTAALEAVRQGQEGAVQGQLLQARRQSVLDRMTEAHEVVPMVEGSEELRLDPDQSPEDQKGSGGGARDEENEADSKASNGAGPAEGHLDLLA